MTRFTDKEYRTLLRQDLMTFIERSFRELYLGTEFLPNWHIEVIANALEDCMLGKCRRLIINVPPRSLKSHCASVAFPAWLLGNLPSAQIICASYGQDLADKHARDTRTLMTSDFYLRTFPTRLTSDRPALDELLTTEGGFRFATSVGGSLTGRGGDFLIIDDPSKPEEAISEVRRKTVNEWYDHTLLSRLNNKKTGCIIIITQRLHEDDLVGHVLGSDDWRYLCFPAIAERQERHEIRQFDGRHIHVIRREGEALQPERESLEILDQIRKSIGTYNFAGQYQQRPVPAEGAIVHEDWFMTYKKADLPDKFDYVFQSWDTANKASELSDYSVCTTWGVRAKLYYLLHLLRERLLYPDLKRCVYSQAKEWSANAVVIEDKASGTQLLQDLKREGFTLVKPYSTPADKTMRLVGVSGIFESGCVYLPDQAPWLDAYKHELLTFPAAAHDDQVDSTTGALDWYRSRPRYEYGLIKYFELQDKLATPVQPDASLFLRPRGFGRTAHW